MLYEPKFDTESGGLKFASWQLSRENNQKLVDIDRQAKSEDTILHRYVSEQIADGYAYYQIIRVNKKSVRVRVCTGLGDDWQVPQWGAEATIPMAYAVENIRRRDGLEEIFSRR